MKYIITENKVSNIIKFYLDKLDTWEWDIGDGEFSVSEGYEGDTIMSYSLGDDGEGVLHIAPKIIMELERMFVGAIDFEGLMKTICIWFNEKYGTNVVHYEVVMED